MNPSGWVAANPEAAAAIRPKGALPSKRFKAWMTDDYVMGAAELLMPANSLSANGSWIVVEVSTVDGDEAFWLAMLGDVSGSASQDRVVGDFVDTAWARDDDPKTFLAWRLARDRDKSSFRMSYMIVRQALP